MKLNNYSSENFTRGRSKFIEAVWIISRTIVFSHFVPSSAARVWLLRLFGAHIGQGVVVKPGVNVKFPWRLEIGDHVWLGEGVWIDNLTLVSVGDNTCISQGAYLCTGSHNWKSESFDLITKPISIGSKVWIAARASIGPGVTIGEGSVVCMGCIVTGDVAPWMVLSQSHAPILKPRVLN